MRLPPGPRRARGPIEHQEAIDLRVRVFCDEQGVAPDAEVDGLDEDAIHIVAMERGKVAGTCRLRLLGGHGGSAKLERIAVDKELRGIGLGAALVAKAEEEAKREGAGDVLLHSQVTARRFYERSGYAVVDEEVFPEDGIDHLRMSKRLS